MSKTRAYALSNKSKGAAYESGKGYKGVLRRGSKYGWKYEDGKTSQSKGGFDTAEEAAYNYDEFLIAYVGPNADTNQALGLLKLKHVLEIREKIRKSEKPVNKADRRLNKVGSTGYKGVSKHNSKATPYKSQTYLNGKYIHIGTFATPEEAARAYDAFMLKHNGAKAVTNISLGLLPPLGDKEACKVVEEAIKKAKEPVLPAPTIEPEPVYSVFASPEEEREAQIKAARAMVDDDENDIAREEQSVNFVVNSDSCDVTEFNPLSVKNDTSHTLEESPAPALIQNSEILLMSDADKLRLKAQEFLKQAAEMEAGDIRRKATDRIAVLSQAVTQMQDTMLKLIDTCAEIEIELKNLNSLL